MPAAEVEFDNRHKTLHGIINLWHWKQGIRMCHKTVDAESIGDLSDEVAGHTSLSFPT
jgi:hypothetical protein